MLSPWVTSVFAPAAAFCTSPIFAALVAVVPPLATLLITLPPALMPAVVMLTGSGAVPPTGVAACTVTPAPLMVVVLPAASVVTTLVNVGFSFMLTVTVVLPAASCSTRVNRLSLLVASVVLPATIANSLPNLCVTGLAPPAATGALALTLIPLSATLATAFNCATFTASASLLPAATPVICRVTVPSEVPTDTEPKVDVQAPPVGATAAFKGS